MFFQNFRLENRAETTRAGRLGRVETCGNTRLGELNYISQEATGWAYNTQHAIVPALVTCSCRPLSQGAQQICTFSVGAATTALTSGLSWAAAIPTFARRAKKTLTTIPWSPQATWPARVMWLQSQAAEVCYPGNCWAPQTFPESAEFRDRGRWGVDTCFPLGWLWPRLSSDPLPRALVSQVTPLLRPHSTSSASLSSRHSGTRASWSRAPPNGARLRGSVSDRDLGAKTLTAHILNWSEMLMSQGGVILQIGQNIVQGVHTQRPPPPLLENEAAVWAASRRPRNWDRFENWLGSLEGQRELCSTSHCCIVLLAFPRSKRNVICSNLDTSLTLS